jgi:DNA mismatch repair protein MutL
LLPPALRNQIAAGEVVERPASVLKELVENSLDAGASDITVTLEDGGMTLLAVRDNGRGIPAEDLELAVTRHATSKLADFTDLLTVATYGFRGEALPSIGAVADMLVESVFRPGGGASGNPLPEGAFIRVRHGEIARSGPSALPLGTLVEVRDLFANVPARLKFLKAPGTELKRCQEIFVRLALARPETRFSLHIAGGGKGKELLRIDAGLSLIERLTQAWPPGAVEGMHPFSGERHGLRAHGLAALPQFSQTRADRILLYVNNRPVHNRLLLLALREAYKGRLTSREHPKAVLFLDIDPKEVDVNVHPAKSEVRFRDERAVFSAVRTTLETLLAGNAAGFFLPAPADGPEADADPEERKALLSSRAGMENPLPGLPPLYAGASETRGATGDVVAPPASASSPGTNGNEAHAPRPAGFWGSIDAPRLVDFPAFETKEEGGDPAFAYDPAPFADASGPRSLSGRGERSGIWSGTLSPADSMAGLLRESPTPFLPETARSQTAASAARECRNNGYPVDVGPLLCLGQVADTYLILVQGDSLLLLDQHAAHERVLLHLLEGQTQSAQSQLLALPVDLPLSSSANMRLQELFPELTRLGYSLAADADRVSVAGVPPLLGRGRGLDLLRDILAERTEGIDDLLHLMACHSAIKAGQPLTGDEAAELLRQWTATPDCRFCPHGRPTVLTFDPPSLEKMFKRKIG